MADSKLRKRHPLLSMAKRLLVSVNKQHVCRLIDYNYDCVAVVNEVKQGLRYRYFNYHLHSGLF